jgi:nitrite reductase (NADH) small subunit
MTAAEVEVRMEVEVEVESTVWTPVCAFEQVPVDRGVAALIRGRQVAVFRLHGDGDLYALGNIDPFSGIGCLSRGLVGDHGGEPMVVSPLHKQRFSLRSGICLDDPSVNVARYDVRLAGGTVEVRVS